MNNLPASQTEEAGNRSAVVDITESAYRVYPRKMCRGILSSAERNNTTQGERRNREWSPQFARKTPQSSIQSPGAAVLATVISDGRLSTNRKTARFPYRELPVLETQWPGHALTLKTKP
jgi:hypothetical protein